MSLFYQRKETPDEIIISYNNWIGYFLLGTGLTGLFLNSIGNAWSTTFIWAFALSFAIVFIDTWKPNTEVRKARMQRGVKIEGSYFSFSGSITLKIKKEN
jgi:hypothetical protein